MAGVSLSRASLILLTLLLLAPAPFVAKEAPKAGARTLSEQAVALEKLVDQFPAKGRRPEELLFFGLMGLERRLPSSLDPETAKQLAAIAAKLGANSLLDQPEPRRNLMAWIGAEPMFDLSRSLAGWVREPERVRVLALAAADSAQSWEILDKAAIDGVKLAGKGMQVGVQPVELNRSMFRPTASLLKRLRTVDAQAPWLLDQTAEQPELSPQAQGLAWAFARRAGRHLGQPWMASLPVSSRLQTPEALRRAHYLALGHGAKLFHFDGAVLPGQHGKDERSTNADDAPLWQTLHQLIHEAGSIEKVVAAANPRPADIAFIVSAAEEALGQPESVGEEMKALFVACRQAGYAVDVLSDEDVQRGRHEKYLSIFIVGAHLERKTALELKKWALKGNSLAGYAGGGLWDENGQPMDVLASAYGVTEAKLTHPGKLSRGKVDLARLEPLDQINVDWNGKKGTLPVLAAKITFKQGPTAAVLGRYRDGSPAILRNKCGEGLAFFYGTYVGSGWVRPAMPKREWKPGHANSDFNHFIPLEFDHDQGDEVTAASDESRFHVVTDNLSVETLVLEGPKGLALVCINWAKEPQTAFLTVQHAAPNFTKAASMERGALKMTKIVDPNKPTAVTYSFKLRVNVADVVLLEE